MKHANYGVNIYVRGPLMTKKYGKNCDSVAMQTSGYYDRKMAMALTENMLVEKAKKIKLQFRCQGNRDGTKIYKVLYGMHVN